MQYMNIIFVCNEELKGGMQSYSLCLLGTAGELNCTKHMTGAKKLKSMKFNQPGRQQMAV